MSSKQEFVDNCIRLCSLSDEDIVKRILQDSLHTLLLTHDNSDEDFPENCDIMNYKPTKNTYPDFAIHVCKNLKTNRDIFLREIISKGLDNIVDKTELEIETPSSKRSLPVNESIRRTRSRNVRNYTLPSILSVFTYRTRRGNFETIHDIPTIIKLYFSGHIEMLSETVYGDDSSNYVIFVSDNVDSRWRSNGNSNILTWNILEDESLFKEITNSVSTVHVIRKREGELRYMGKKEHLEDINDKHVIMTVS